METENIKITPEKENASKPSEKFAKAKKVVGKATQLAGAAGIGVVGTVAANAINVSDDNVDDAEAITPTEVDIVTSEDSVEENPATDFNPNDIRIEDVDEVDINQPDVERLVAEVEPEPITIENQDAVTLDDSVADNPNENDWIDEPYIENPQMASENFGDLADDIISNDLA
jgi:hypothetical protein